MAAAPVRAGVMTRGHRRLIAILATSRLNGPNLKCLPLHPVYLDAISWVGQRLHGKQFGDLQKNSAATESADRGDVEVVEARPKKDVDKPVLAL